MTDEELANLVGADVDVSDELHRHFEGKSSGFENWLDVAYEGRRVFNLMFNDEVERDSPVDNVFTAIAAESSYVGVKAVSEMLGLDARAVASMVGDWTETRRWPVGIEGLLVEYQRHLGFVDRVILTTAQVTSK